MVTSLAQDVTRLIDVHKAKNEGNATSYHNAVVKTHESVMEKIKQIQSTLDHITHTNAFMLMIINRSIDFTKVSNGFKLEPRSEVVQLREVLDIPIKCMRDMQNRIKIMLNPISDQIAAGIVTDRQWLLDNVLCMLGNAVKYSLYGVVRVTVSLESNGNEVFQQHLAEHSLVFEFEDTGVGVSAHEKKELFVSILQTKRSSGGTGLGTLIYVCIEYILLICYLQVCIRWPNVSMPSTEPTASRRARTMLQAHGSGSVSPTSLTSS